MASAANIIIYAQPVKTEAREVGMAWVDTSKTISFRKTVGTKEEGEALLTEACSAAEKLGGRWVLKALVQKIEGIRRPANLRLPALTMVGA